MHTVKQGVRYVLHANGARKYTSGGETVHARIPTSVPDREKQYSCNNEQMVLEVGTKKKYSVIEVGTENSNHSSHI